MSNLFLSLMSLLAFSSCTLSFSNVDTHGTASDLIEETQTASPTVSPNVNVPISLVPKATSVGAK